MGYMKNVRQIEVKWDLLDVADLDPSLPFHAELHPTEVCPNCNTRMQPHSASGESPVALVGLSPGVRGLMALPHTTAAQNL